MTMTRIFSLIGLLTLTSPAVAQQTLIADEVFKEASGWSIGVTSTNGGCIALAQFKDTSWFVFGYDGLNKPYMGIANQDWNAAPGTAYKFEIRFTPSNRGFNAEMIGTKEANGYSVTVDEDFMNLIAESKRVDFTSNGNAIVNFLLIGTRAAMNELRTCQAAWKDIVAENESSEKAINNNQRPIISSGTGFFVSQGTIMTADHVINRCTSDVMVSYKGVKHKAKIVAKDAANDMAVLSTDFTAAQVLSFNNAPRLGEAAYTFGFPLPGHLSSSGVFTMGNVSGLTGANADWRFLQVSTPIQQGNSGGALVNAAGDVIGIVLEKLNAMSVAKETGDLPQNVNFAAKSKVMLTFLEESNIKVGLSDNKAPLGPEDIAEKVQAASVEVSCEVAVVN